MHAQLSKETTEKEFEYKIYNDAPGGHIFNQIDMRLARESQREVYSFLAKYLKPPNPFTLPLE